MFQTRPVIMGVHGCVTSSHYLATEAGFEMLRAGGNAADAAVAAGLAMHVVEPQNNGFGGEVPILVYSPSSAKVFAISGQGTAPRKATVEYFEQQRIDLIPGDGFLPATVCGAFDAWVTLLREFGTMRLSQVIQPAIILAQDGFAIYPELYEHIRDYANRMLNEWPTSAEVFLRNRKVPRVGDIFKQRDIGSMLRKLEEAEGNHERVKGLNLARDYFYKGPIARRIVAFSTTHQSKDATGKAHHSLLSEEDFSDYRSRVEEPVNITYKGLRVHKCGPWSQGPVFLQQLRLLEEFDLKDMGHNSADYIHTVTEAAKLAFADRERYYGDPLFTDVPLQRLLSRDYAKDRSKLITRQASMRLQAGVMSEREDFRESRHYGDTTHLDVVDSAGNMISATPSGGWFFTSPIVEGLGFALGTRAQMFSLKRGHPNCLMPGKRPRTTLTPSMVTVNNKPFLAFGTPGGDQQDQWTLQFFLNYVEFNMNLQKAIDAPTFHTTHFPSSFYPRDAHPGRLHVEDRIPASVIRNLRKRGHKVILEDGWANGQVTAVHFDSRSRLTSAAASPRVQTPYALGW